MYNLFSKNHARKEIYYSNLVMFFILKHAYKAINLGVHCAYNANINLHLKSSLFNSVFKVIHPRLKMREITPCLYARRLDRKVLIVTAFDA